mgnify:CR=1 FL=1
MQCQCEKIASITTVGISTLCHRLLNRQQRLHQTSSQRVKIASSTYNFWANWLKIEALKHFLKFSNGHITQSERQPLQVVCQSSFPRPDAPWGRGKTWGSPPLHPLGTTTWCTRFTTTDGADSCYSVRWYNYHQQHCYSDAFRRLSAPTLGAADVLPTEHL